MKQMPTFWGCTFIHNLPFLMESTKKVLKKMEIEPVEIENASCCPNHIYLGAYGKDFELALAARNLALGEKMDGEMLVICNGCFIVLNESGKELKDHNLRERVNSFLPGDLEYKGNVRVVHLHDRLTSEISTVKALVKKPLKGLRVAVHYGCHCLHPPAVATDDPEDPSSLDQLVEATGAESIDYEGKLDCCGVPVAAFDLKEADQLLQNKLLSVKKGKADCIVTTCPGCFLRFDVIANNQLKELSIPVIHLSELLCLAFGIPPEELFFQGHFTDVSPLLGKLELEMPELDAVKLHFDLETLARHCGACSKECTAAVRTRDTAMPFNPLEVVEKLERGRLSEVLSGKEIWRCLQCGACEERCPNNVGLKEMFAKLRVLAVAEGNLPRMVEERRKTLEKTGYGMPVKKYMRKKMGIEDAPELETGEIREILEKTLKAKKDE